MSKQLFDILRFTGGIADGEVRGWDGPWPPPSRFVFAVGNESGYISIFDPDDSGLPHTLDEVKAVARVQFYRRGSYSRLPDDHGSSRVARGAEYVPEGETS